MNFSSRISFSIYERYHLLVLVWFYASARQSYCTLVFHLLVFMAVNSIRLPFGAHKRDIYGAFGLKFKIHLVSIITQVVELLYIGCVFCYVRP